MAESASIRAFLPVFRGCKHHWGESEVRDTPGYVVDQILVQRCENCGREAIVVTPTVRDTR